MYAQRAHGFIWMITGADRFHRPIRRSRGTAAQTGFGVSVTPDKLIDLSTRKNAAHSKLVRKRAAVYIPSTGSKSTSDDRKVALDDLTRIEQEEYDNLLDEFNVLFEAFKKPLNS